VIGRSGDRKTEKPYQLINTDGTDSGKIQTSSARLVESDPAGASALAENHQRPWLKSTNSRLPAAGFRN
jgi:hypothetical protein